jgi:tripartite-type tricarboxylate transporter receptor subunit TctC
MNKSACNLLTLLLCFSPVALAQTASSYPDKPVRIVVPWAAGGNIDVLTRIAAQQLTRQFGQQVIVDNRGGANGMIGSEAVVRAAPDGYTLLVDGLQTHVINPHVFPKMAYDSARDLAMVTLLGSVQYPRCPSLPSGQYHARCCGLGQVKT